MAYNNNREGYVLNEEQVISFLKETLNRVENASEADIKTLAEIKKLFKKTVPFSRRNYVAAMLIKSATQGFKSNRFNKKDRVNSTNDKPARAEKAERSTEEKTERAPRITIAPEAAGTIFVSVGKSRGVYPRDLVGLLVSVAGFDRSRIGEIRVLSNYSFIQLFAEDCEKAISALNDYEYRGRKLSVSYSAKKGEKEDKSESVKTAPVQTEEKVEVVTNAAVETKTETITEERIPSNVTNESYGVSTENTEEKKIAEEQATFAQAMSSSVASDEKPYSETTDDGQVKSHFGDGAAY